MTRIIYLVSRISNVIHKERILIIRRERVREARKRIPSSKRIMLKVSGVRARPLPMHLNRVEEHQDVLGVVGRINSGVAVTSRPSWPTTADKQLLLWLSRLTLLLTAVCRNLHRLGQFFLPTYFIVSTWGHRYL